MVTSTSVFYASGTLLLQLTILLTRPLDHANMTLRPNRVPILYLILGVLLLVSVVPMYFYANLVVDKNRERLKSNQMILQNPVTKSLSDDLGHRQATLRMMLENLASA